MNVLYSKNARFRILAHFILLAISMLCSGQVFAQTFADGDLTYSTVGVPAGQVKVTGCAADPCASLDIDIPVTATGATTYSVTRIKENAFARRNIASVKIPSTITVIEFSAFEVNALASLIIPDSVIAIGNGAFFSNGIRSLILPATVTALGQGVFEENELTSLTIQEGVESIPASTFAGNNLAIVTIPSSVTTIGVSAFEQNKLTLVAFKGNRGSFDDQTFGNNVNLARITYCEGASGWPGTPFNRGIPNTSTNTVTPVAVSCNVLPPATIAQVPTSPLWLLGIMAGLLSVLGIRKLPQA